MKTSLAPTRDLPAADSLVVYQTSDGGIHAAYQVATAAVAAYTQLLNGVLDRYGTGARERVFTRGLQPGRLAGLRAAACGCLPAGWTLPPGETLGRPDGRTRTGRALNREIDSLRYPGGFRDGLPGMPNGYPAPGKNQHPRTVTCEFSERNGIVYATWEPPGPDPAGIDTALWAAVAAVTP